VEPIPLRYALGLGALMLLAGAFTGFAGLLVGKVLLMGLGALHVFLGVAYLVAPVVVVHADRIEMKNLFGMTLKTHQVAVSDLELQGKKIFRRGDAKPLAGGVFLRGADVERLRRALT